MSINKTVTHHTDMETWHRGSEVTSHTPGVAIEVEWRAGYAADALARFPSEDDSVHLRQFPDVPAAWHDPQLGARWERIRRVRRVLRQREQEERDEV